MAAKLDIRGVHFNVDESLKKYITKKVNKLEKYVSPDARNSLHVEVFMSESKTKGGKVCECEVIMHLPKETVRIKDGTMNMYAAVDIIEEKLKQALKKYKDLHNGGKRERHLLGRVRFQF